MKKIFIILFLIGVLVVAMVYAGVSLKGIPSVDTEQKLKSYADVNLKDSIKYSNFEVLKIEKFDEFVIIYFHADGKDQRWFKTIKSFDKLIK